MHTHLLVVARVVTMPRNPCLDCGKPTSDGSRCSSCQSLRPKRDQRGNADRPAWRRAYGDPSYRGARARLRGLPCWMCGQPSDTVDHLVPLSKGGTNEEGNLAPACRGCNSGRGARHG